jgi:anthranilate phosphoribosyltransferase/flavin-binding protein dodecin
MLLVDGLSKGKSYMSVARVTELSATSQSGFEDAIKEAIDSADQTSPVEVRDNMVHVDASYASYANSPEGARNHLNAGTGIAPETEEPRSAEGWRDFAPYLKALARGPDSLADLEPEFCQEAMELILAGVASPAQAASFLMIGRVKGNSASELAATSRALRSFLREIPAPPGPVVTVTGGFDGKLRTLNLGAAASLVAAAAGARVLIVGSESVPPKEGYTNLGTLRSLGAHAPQTIQEAGASLAGSGFAATSLGHYLPELHGLLQLRREMARRTALNVSEKLVSPVPGSAMMVGMTHRKPFLETMPRALTELGVGRALVFQAIEGSDEAPLDGASALVVIEGENIRENAVSPERLGLRKVPRSEIPSPGAAARHPARAVLEGEPGPLRDMILYNAALRIWMSEGDEEAISSPLEDRLLEPLARAGDALDSGEALALLESLRP